MVELYFSESQKSLSETSSIYHMKCFTKTPFVALRNIPVETKRLVTVDYVALASPPRARSVGSCYSKSERARFQVSRPMSVLSSKQDYPEYYQTKFHKDIKRDDSEFEYHVR